MQVLQEQKPASSIIQTFEADFLASYPNVLPSQLNALAAMKTCRTTLSPLMRADCEACDHPCFIPHSCGHRGCPHCQHYEAALGHPWPSLHSDSCLSVSCGCNASSKNSCQPTISY